MVHPLRMWQMSARNEVHVSRTAVSNQLLIVFSEALLMRSLGFNETREFLAKWVHQHRAPDTTPSDAASTSRAPSTDNVQTPPSRGNDRTRAPSVGSVASQRSGVIPAVRSTVMHGTPAVHGEVDARRPSTPATPHPSGGAPHADVYPPNMHGGSPSTAKHLDHHESAQQHGVVPGADGTHDGDAHVVVDDDFEVRETTVAIAYVVRTRPLCMHALPLMP